MRNALAVISITVVVLAISPGGRLLALTDAIHVHDDVIYLDPNSGEPNASPAEDMVVSCPQMPPEMGPALVYIDSKPLDERLHVACFRGRDMQKLDIASAKYIRVTQLDNAVFLVATTGGSMDRGLFVMDLRRGIGRRLARSSRISCLRSVPERGKAMLSHSDLEIGEVRYLELDLATLGLTLVHTFKQADLGDKFIGTYYGTALSPDFEQTAFAACHTSSNVQWHYDYRLMLLNLSTMQERVLDEHVGTEVPPYSSSMKPFAPPLDWINDHEIVYRHTPAREVNEVNFLQEPLHLFKHADTATGQITTIFEAKLRWVDSYGDLKLNPLNGELIYNNQWILHPATGTLTSAILPFSVVNDYQQDRATVYLDEQLLETAAGRIAPTLISASHQNFAYVLHPADADPNTVLSVKIAGEDDPIEVDENSNATTLAGWVE